MGKTHDRDPRRLRITLLAVAVVAGAIGIAETVRQDGGSAPAPQVAASPSPPDGGPAAPGALPSPGEPTVSKSGSIAKDRKTLQVVSAKADLTGNRELAWAGDAGQPVGEAYCTQNFRIGEEKAATERPTMLMCWRLSPTRSVYTIAVDIDKRPSAQDSVETIDQVWERLG